MSRGERRLRLVSAPPPPTSGEVLRFVAPRPTFALADARDGATALSFALHLSRGLKEVHGSASVLLCAFSEEPGASLAHGFDRDTPVFLLAIQKPDDLALFFEGRADQPSPWVIIGDPALIACDGALRIALSTPSAGVVPRPLWSELKRRAHLELPAPTPKLASALVAAWGRPPRAP